MRILVADDHEIVRRGVRSLFSTRAGWEICAECSNGRDAVEQSSKLRPDVAVLDATMPELNGIEAARRIRRESPGTAVIIYTVHDNEQIVREVLLTGARGCISKSMPPRHLVSAVDAAHRQSSFFVSVPADGALPPVAGHTSARSENHRSSLSSREREIVQMISEVKTNKEIAVSLGISLRTVEAHRRNVKRKLRADSAAGIVRYAIRHHLIDP